MMITTAGSLQNQRRVSDMCDALICELTDVLEAFNGEESLKEVFWSILSYDRQRLPLAIDGIRPDVADAVVSLEVFASHDDISVIRVETKVLPTHKQIESLCGTLEPRFPTLLLLLHVRGDDSWMLIYTDRSRKHHLRYLQISGSPTELQQTATALAALTAVDWDTDESLQRLDVAQQMDVFFPGAMPQLRWEFDSSLESSSKSTSYMRNKAAPVADLYEDISRYPLLTERQERGEDLDCDTVAGAEMNDYRWRLVLHNVRLVINLALKFPTNVLDVEDLVQEGMLGLISAARKYDVSRGTRFSTYAWYWIRQGIFRAISQNHNLIRWPCHRASDLVPANRDGETTQLAPGERYVSLLESMDIDDSDAIEIHEENSLERAEQIEALQDGLRFLDDRQQRVLRLRYGLDTVDEWTLEEVGESERVTRERIRQIQRSAVGKLRTALPPWLREEFEQSQGDDSSEEMED